MCKNVLTLEALLVSDSHTGTLPCLMYIGACLIGKDTMALTKNI